METKERLNAGSSFELASISKQFTAVGILKLVDEGKLRLDQNLESVFPNIPYKGITIRQLLNHTSGLPDYGMLVWTHRQGNRIYTNADVIGMLTKYKPERSFEPGTSWEYSNTGYAVLAAVIEKESGKSFSAYMQEAVFAPLHLDQTQVYMRRFAPQSVAGYAYGYVNDGGTYRLPDSLADYSYVVCLDGIAGDGNIRSTAGDLLRWNNAIRNQLLLSAQMWRDATTAAVIGGESTAYGFGWMVSEDPAQGRTLAHNGSWPGYHTLNVLYLDQDISTVFLSNRESAPGIDDQIYEAVKNIVFGKPAAFPKPQMEVHVDQATYKLYEGVYESVEVPGFALTIRSRAGRLYMQATGQGENEVRPESQQHFFVAGSTISIDFEGKVGTPASTLVLHQHGEHEFKRK